MNCAVTVRAGEVKNDCAWVMECANGYLQRAFR